MKLIFFWKGFDQDLSGKVVENPIREQHLVQTVKHPQKQMFWVYFTCGGPGSLVPVEGIGNSDVNPIENLWSFVKRHASKVDCST
ncbi:hypothetical protein TNCV_4925071 [Trichonephila clavipes]|nr:hypothetical protein TNCV_4925071 [Trichonephila clavipes]